MKKHLQRLLLLAALLVPWVTQAQTLDEYTFSTGTDASKWVTMTSATSILTTQGDGTASSVQSIGFSFPFGNSTYTQFSVNSDGNLRLGSTVTTTSAYSTPFSSSYANSNNPKINAFGCDGYLSTGHYVKKLLVGDSMLCVEFCMGTYTSSTRSQLYKWQIHLHTNGKVEIVFPSSSDLPSTNPATTHQCGICVNSSDGWIVNSSNNAEHFTSGSSTTWSSGTWFSANRYYTFAPPVYSCPAPTHLTVSNLDTNSFTLTWSDTTAASWIINMGNTLPSIPVTDTTRYTFTGLTPATLYNITLIPICQNGDSGQVARTSVRTLCAPVHTLPYTYGFEDLTSTGSGTDIHPCWTRGTGSYPYAQATAHTGSRSIYFYGSGTSTRSWVCLPVFDNNINTLRLQFWAKKGSLSYSGLIKVGVMTNPATYSTFQTLHTLYTDATTNWNHFEVTLANAPSTGGYITIMVPGVESGSGTNYIYLDDVTVDAIPYCTTPVVDSIVATSNSVDFYVSDIDNAQDISLTLTRGTWDTTVTSSSSPVSVYDLTSGTTYNYSIRAYCSSTDSTNARTGSFNTLCVPIENTSLPYTYGFEDLTTTGQGSLLNPCWRRGYKNGSNYADNNYPYSSSSYYHTGSR